MEFTCTFDLTGKDFDSRARDEVVDILKRLTRDVTLGNWAAYMRNSSGKEVGFWEVRATSDEGISLPLFGMKEAFCGYCDCDTMHITKPAAPEMQCVACDTVRYAKLEEDLPDCGRR